METDPTPQAAAPPFGRARLDASAGGAGPFLVRLGDALRTIADPAGVQAEAARVLGEHLEVARAYYAEVDDGAREYVVARDWHRPGASSHARRYPIGQWSLPLATDGTTWVVRDVETDPTIPDQQRAAYREIGIGASVVVPLIKHDRLVALFVVNQPEPRAWTDIEVALVEETAERTWAAVERAQAQDALRTSEAQFRAFTEATTDVLYRMSPDWGEMCWLSGGSVLADTVAPRRDWMSGYLLPEDQRSVTAAIAEAVRTTRPFETEHRVRRRDGSVGWVLSRAVPLLDEHGGITEWFGAASDVTARKKVQEALRESEERYRLIVEGAREYAMLGMDPEGRITSWNSGAERIFGYPEAEALGQPGAFIFTAEDRADGVPEQEAEVALREGQAVDERPHVRKDGTRFWASGMLTALHDPAGSHRGFVKVLRDNSKRKEAEAALHASEARFRAAAETVPDILFTATPDGRVDYVNPRLEDITGVLPADVLGTSIWPTLLHPDDRASHETAWASARREGRPFEDRHRLRRPDGSYCWFLARARPVVGPEGGVTRWFGTCTDIHRIVEAEAEVHRLNATLERRVEERSAQVRELARALTLAEQAERQRVAYVLHDDLQQRLYGLAMTLSLLGRYCEGRDAATLHARAEETLEGAAALTRTLSHEIAPALLQTSDLGELLRWLADRKREALGLEIEVEVHDSVSVTEEAVRVLLYQLLQELLFNVTKHAGVRRARVVAERDEDVVRVTVEDDGAGFDASTLGTAEAKRGAGLGLPSVRDRLELVGGQLEIVSAPGKGTRVTFTVPRGFDAES